MEITVTCVGNAVAIVDREESVAADRQIQTIVGGLDITLGELLFHVGETRTAADCGCGEVESCHRKNIGELGA